jgi:uroporphyrinogen-III synthase
MQKTKRHILSTRPLAEKLIQEAAAQHIIIDQISLIETAPILDAGIATYVAELFQKPITAVFTSMNAVTAVSDLISGAPDWKVYSIGEATASLVKQLYQIPIAGTGVDAAALADVIIKDGLKEVHFFCGNIRRDVLPHTLRNANILVEEIVVYQTRETPQRVTAFYDAVLFYSPSAVTSFFSVNVIPNGTVLFAIGHTTAAAIHEHTNAPVIIAEHPGKEALVKQVMNYFNEQKCKTE